MTNKKRGLIIIIPLLLATLYSIYWVAVIGFIEDGFQSWVMNEIKNNQADIQFEQITRSGFPFSLALTVDNFTYSQNKQTMVATIPTINFKVSPLNWYDTAFGFSNGATIINKKNQQTA